VGWWVGPRDMLIFQAEDRTFGGYVQALVQREDTSSGG